MKNILICSEQEYEQVAKRMEELKNAPARSNPAKELKLLTKAIIQYQRKKLHTANFARN
ncbi:MAG: hypothetical protein M3Q05_13860 [Bacteroidota bacterium]|nr:hypothetical protein [Bacteroidota bacterium]